MLTVLHISDLHCGPPFVRRVGEAALASAAALQPDCIVASGDFTQRAKPEQFVEARQFLDALPRVPLVVCPGNHDVPLYRIIERLRSPLGLYRQYIADELDSVLRLEGVTIVSLNSTAPYTAISNGRIHRHQLEFCQRAFETADEEEARIVVAHHHFAPAPDYEKAEVMPKARRALDVFAELKVDMILGGHLHRAYIGNSLDVYPGGDRQHGMIIVQSGTTTSRRGRAREREKNTFNLIRVDHRTIRITHYMYFDAAGGFEPFSRHIFPRARLGHLGGDDGN
ncbi:MAG: metallophosphoesterase [Planctomycetes bacterium]|nr:metallophosphoesterase [Planctomycetota bacterium]